MVLTGEFASFEDRRDAVHRFFRNCGRKYLQHRLDFFGRTMGLAPRSVSFRSQSTRWGSCSSSGHISINWRLIAAPTAVVDYVIIHEIAHLAHPNHGPHFWALVAEFSPRYKEFKSWLRENQWAFDFLSKDYTGL